MASNVVFKDFSMEIKAALDEASIAALYEIAAEVTSQAQRTCVMEDDAGKRLKGSYANTVDESKGMATVGTPLEEGYWEEFGTGEHADTAKNGGKPGRQGWWVYVKGQGTRAKVSAEYRDKEEAEAVAASMRAEGLDAYATNGRDPHYTLERSFEAKAEWAKKHVANTLKERLE
ncbi:MAG: hypothetical protein IJV91_05665 [Kiritimatiellae bacterium]|nr:hypothetical protein [Kiritimatiellia bacterium]